MEIKCLHQRRLNGVEQIQVNTKNATWVVGGEISSHLERAHLEYTSLEEVHRIDPLPPPYDSRACKKLPAPRMQCALLVIDHTNKCGRMITQIRVHEMHHRRCLTGSSTGAEST